MDDFLGVWPRDDAGCGRPEYRFSLLGVPREAVLPVALLRRESSWKLVAPLVPLPWDMTMDDAGELPGVSIALRAAGLSSVRIVDTESRS